MAVAAPVLGAGPDPADLVSAARVKHRLQEVRPVPDSAWAVQLLGGLLRGDVDCSGGPLRQRDGGSRR